MPERKDYYGILGIERSASKDEIKKIRRRLAQKWHPDVNPSEEAKEQFQLIEEAYKVLSDDQQRAFYDQYGHAPNQPEDGRTDGFEFRTSVDGNFSDIFDNIFSEFGDMFGGAGGPRSARSAKGRDRELSIDFTLEEIATGINKSIRLPVVVQCEECKGTGKSSHRETTICSDCKGSGKTKVNRGSFFLQRTCTTCRGEGYLTHTPCENCDGHGYKNKVRRLSVTIPAGVEQNDLIRLPGKGDAGRNEGPPGDLYIRINEIPHPFFRRKGNDLHCEIPVSVVKAALGATVEIPTLKGTSNMEIPPETQNGDIVTLKGEGIKRYDSKRGGNLKCHINVETPVNLNPRQASLLRELQASMDDDSAEHYPRSGRSWFEKVKEFFE